MSAQTGRKMPGESTTPDPAELQRVQLEAVNRRDLDVLLRYCAPDIEYDTSPSGMGTYVGHAAVRDFIYGYWDLFEELTFHLEEFLDLGNGVTLTINRQEARPTGSTAQVQTREAHVTEWLDGMIAKVTVYRDIDQGRAAAERLAESKGQV